MKEINLNILFNVQENKSLVLSIAYISSVVSVQMSKAMFCNKITYILKLPENVIGYKKDININLESLESE